jgi:hypothetical protein
MQHLFEIGILAADRRPRSHFPARPTIEFRSFIKPELGELQVRRNPSRHPSSNRNSSRVS